MATKKMNVLANLHRLVRCVRLLAGALIFAPFISIANANPLQLETSPLFTTSAADANLILAIDDSGSMDSEVLFLTNDGAAWWHTGQATFAGSGAVSENQVNFNESGAANNTWKKYTYLFPNGTGAGNRVYKDERHAHFAIPPFKQFAFTRCAAYNRMYFDPSETYRPWPSEGAATFSEADPADAPSDPSTGTYRFDLKSPLDLLGDHKEFRVYQGMVIPQGTEFHDGSVWKTAAEDLSVPDSDVSNGDSIGVRYYPAVYYTQTNIDLGYTITEGGDVISGNCSNPDSSHYASFEKAPSSFTVDSSDPSLLNIVALGPDGACLQETVIQPEDAEMQAFANWFTYYRKRHLALRSGMGQAFRDLTGMRVGLFTINKRNNVTMRSLEEAAGRTGFYNQLYGVSGNSGGTPNRAAMVHIGNQFKRTDSNAPVTLECQKNFGLLFTDGFSTTSGASVGNVDGSDGAPYADNHSNTIADIARKHYKDRLRSDLEDGQVAVAIGCNTPDPDPILDCNRDLHINTFTVGLGNFGTIFGVTHQSIQDAYLNPPAWPNVNATRDPTQIDDLYHAAVNGKGDMLNASSATDIQDKLTRALVGVQEQIGVASAVTFNTATLETNSALYLASFNSGNWSGDLVALPLDSLGGVGSVQIWSAADQIDSALPAPDTRVILTQSGSQGVPFRWTTDGDAALSAEQQADLQSNSYGTGQQILEFIRGDRTSEGPGRLRVRASALGDIVHSSPVFVGAPNLGWPDEAPFPEDSEAYSEFRASLLSAPRAEMIYFGGNDGMLHGLDAGTGIEKLAYIPQYLFSPEITEGLNYLANPAYQHRYYVDLPPTASDVYLDLGAGPAWRTILIGGSRAGGAGLFMLDITDPSNFSEENAQDIVAWEFTHPNLGKTYSKPTIAMMENGRWAAIVGNGYNATGSGTSQLLILFLDGFNDGVWTENTDYIFIDTGANVADAPNGMASPAVVDIDGNGAADRVYAGDLEGNLWAFDLSSSNAADWGSAYSGNSDPSGPTPLFTTETGTPSIRQPITTKPSVALHPSVPNGANTAPDLMVFFGTGKYLEETDLSSQTSQSFYGIWDHGRSQLDRENLGEQTFVNNVVTDSEGTQRNDIRVLSEIEINYNTLDGWFVDLPAAGERVVVDPGIRGSLVFFNTWIPNSDPCGAGGSGFLMSVEQANGGAPNDPAFNMLGEALDEYDYVLVNNQKTNPAGQQFDNGLPAPSSFLGNKQYTPGTGSEVVQTREVEDLGGPGTGRLSWQQLIAE